MGKNDENKFQIWKLTLIKKIVYLCGEIQLIQDTYKKNWPEKKSYVTFPIRANKVKESC